MTEPQKHIRQWINDIVETRRWKVSELARKAGLTPSTLTRFMKEDHIGALSNRTIQAISITANVPPPGYFDEKTAIHSSFQEVEVVPFVGPNSEANGNPDISTWSIRTRKLQLAGYMPGDTIWADTRLKPDDGDLVIAQIYDHDTGTAQTVIRLLKNNQLITASPDINEYECDSINDRSINILQVVFRSERILRDTSAT